MSFALLKQGAKIHKLVFESIPSSDQQSASHANILGMERRLKQRDDGGWTYKENPSRQTRYELAIQ